MIQQKISPFLWFDGQAEEAANHYVAIFPNSSVRGISRFTETGPGPKGSAMVVTFQLDGQEFYALNGGPSFKFTEAISFVVNCETQAEVDRYWDLLSAGGQEVQCGWLKDKFGLCWQIVPAAFMKMVQDPDSAKVDRVMKAMMTMKKLNLAELEKAYRGE